MSLLWIASTPFLFDLHSPERPVRKISTEQNSMCAINKWSDSGTRGCYLGHDVCAYCISINRGQKKARKKRSRGCVYEVVLMYCIHVCSRACCHKYQNYICKAHFPLTSLCYAWLCEFTLAGLPVLIIVEGSEELAKGAHFFPPPSPCAFCACVHFFLII